MSRSRQWTLVKDRVYFSLLVQPELMVDLTFHLCPSEFACHVTLFGVWLGFDAYWGKENNVWVEQPK